MGTLPELEGAAVANDWNGWDLRCPIQHSAYCWGYFHHRYYWEHFRHQVAAASEGRTSVQHEEAGAREGWRICTEAEQVRSHEDTSAVSWALESPLESMMLFGEYAVCA